MIVIFDLDGVLVNTKEYHFQALNQALPTEYCISKEEHLLHCDGLTTKNKLEMLSHNKGLPIELHNSITQKKNTYFEKYLEYIKPNYKLQDIFGRLKQQQHKVYIASNSLHHTTEKAIEQLGLGLLIDGFYSNQAVSKPKPHPEMFMQIMLREKVSPAECLIVEDSPIGLTAAYRSGAHVLRVNSPEDITFDLIYDKMKSCHRPKLIWEDANMNVIIPMAGEGRRFAEAGYIFPKPLISIGNKTLIQYAVDSLNVKAKLYFLVQEKDYNKYLQLRTIYPNSHLIPVKNTEGAACTTLYAADFINNDNPLLIANCDQWIQYNSLQFFYSMQNVDAGMLTFHANDPKWSYARTNENNLVLEVAEKKIISTQATCGIYYWAKGRDYVYYARQMIRKNIRVNNEFYVCPVFNEALANGKKIKTYPIIQMYGLGTPEDLKKNSQIVQEWAK